MSQWQGGLPRNVISPPTLSPGWRNTSIFIQGQKPKQANSNDRDPGSKSWLCLLGTWIKDFTLPELSYCLKRSINNIPSRIVTINSAEDVKWNAYDVEGDCLLIKAKELGRGGGNGAKQLSQRRGSPPTMTCTPHSIPHTFMPKPCRDCSSTRSSKGKVGGPGGPSAQHRALTGP